MWLFTKDGFFSIVRDAGDPETVWIRGRRERDLRNIRDRLETAPRPEVISTPEADYPFRIRVGRREFAKLMAEMAVDLDYSNFKAKIRELEGPSPFFEALHEIWAVLRGTIDQREARANKSERR